VDLRTGPVNPCRGAQSPLPVKPPDEGSGRRAVGSGRRGLGKVGARMGHLRGRPVWTV